VTLRTADGIGIETTTSWSVGAAEEVAPEPKMGVDRPDLRADPGPGLDAKDGVDPDEVGGESKRVTSKSDPVGPRDFDTSRDAGS